MDGFSRKIALLTLDHLIEEGTNDYSTLLCLGIYNNFEPCIEKQPFENGKAGIEGRIQRQVEHTQLIATKTFDDDREIQKIIEELAIKYRGKVTENNTNLYSIAHFNVTMTELIVTEYFKLH